MHLLFNCVARNQANDKRFAQLAHSMHTSNCLLFHAQRHNWRQQNDVARLDQIESVRAVFELHQQHACLRIFAKLRHFSAQITRAFGTNRRNRIRTKRMLGDTQQFTPLAENNDFCGWLWVSKKIKLEKKNKQRGKERENSIGEQMNQQL